MFNSPLGITYDNNTQNMYMADSNNHVIRKVDPKLNISVYAGVVGQSTPFDTTSTSTSNNCASIGIGSTCQSITNYATKVQENGNVLQTTFNNPTDVCVDRAGNVYVADCSNNVIRKINTNGKISTYGGNGNNRIDSLIKTPTQDYKNIVSNELSYPSRIAADSKGNIYVIEASHPNNVTYGNHTVRMINPNGTITVFAGSEDNTTNATAATVAGKTTPGIINGILLSATFTNPSGIFIDTRDNIYIIDNDGINIRKISDNKVSTIIDENNNTKKEKFNYIMVDKNQNIYATTAIDTVILIKAKHTLDMSNNDTINYMNNGILNYTQIAGGTTDDGTNTIALNAKISNPMGLCQDVNKNLFFVEGNSLRKMYQSGNLHT
jgi:sugar lactone lactonase YvrE